MRKKLKGSALLWSVCSLLIVVFVLTGLLALNKSYAEEEINNIAARKAEYLARSGVEITAELISQDKLTDKKTDEDIVRANVIEVSYSMDGNTVNAVVERTSGDEIRIIATAGAGNMTGRVTGIMKSTDGKWVLKGYATN